MSMEARGCVYSAPIVPKEESLQCRVEFGITRRPISLSDLDQKVSEVFPDANPEDLQITLSRRDVVVELKEEDIPYPHVSPSTKIRYDIVPADGKCRLPYRVCLEMLRKFPDGANERDVLLQVTDPPEAQAIIL